MLLSGGQRRAGAKPGVYPEFERCVLLHQVGYLMIVVAAPLNRVQIRTFSIEFGKTSAEVSVGDS